MKDIYELEWLAFKYGLLIDDIKSNPRGAYDFRDLNAAIETYARLVALIDSYYLLTEGV